MKTLYPFALLLLVSLAAVAAPPEKKRDASLEPIQDDPKLPRVLLIGDSISMGYTLPTRELLKGKANVHRIPTNGGPTIRGIEQIDKWLGGGKWDVIHFNFGLHDIVEKEGKNQVPLDQYQQNLRTLVARMKKTGAKLIWATTTPVPSGPLTPSRRVEDLKNYNAAAEKIMKEEGIAIDDLNGFIAPKIEQAQRPNNVHFTAEGSQMLAEQVARSIKQALGK